jgi:hypothetical protein
MTYRLVVASEERPGKVHLEHSGGLTFCGKESGFYYTHGAGYLHALEALPSVSCRRCYHAILALRSKQANANRLYADWRGDRISDAEYVKELRKIGYRKDFSVGGKPVWNP